MAQESQDPWKILNITPTIDAARIREAYLAQVRRHHPDQFRQDPIRYHQQEEYMKTINAAYRWALNNPPEPHGQAAAAGSSGATVLNCPIHNQPSVRRCQRCNQVICLACAGFQQSLCARHYQAARLHQARGRVLQEWLPLIALIALLRVAGLSGLLVAAAALLYLALLGLRLLLRHHWFGCLTIILLPYSLVLAGVWSLVESLKNWNGKAAG